MQQDMCTPCADQEWVRRTRLFREWETIRQSILEHKWYESEKAGYDIGWQRAAHDWWTRYGRRRR